MQDKYLILEKGKVVNIVIGEVDGGLLAIGDLAGANIGDTVAGNVLKKPTPPKLSYADKRKNAYPTIGDQLDALYHSMSSGEIPKANDFFNAIDAVKKKYPKTKDKK